MPEPLTNASRHKSNRTADYSLNIQGSRQTKTPSTPNDSVATPPAPSSASPLPPPTAISPSSGNTPLSDSVKELLPLLKAQTPHYMVAHIHEKAYLVTEGDTVRLPFLMAGVQPGDVLRLNRATVLGSRDFTLRAAAPVKGTREDPGRKMRWVDERVFVCRATVVGVESEPMRVKEKTKQRNRHVKHAKSKHKYTVLRISELTVRDVNEIKANEKVRVQKAHERLAMLAEKEAAREAAAHARAAAKLRKAEQRSELKKEAAKRKSDEKTQAAHVPKAEVEPEKQAA